MALLTKFGDKKLRTRAKEAKPNINRTQPRRALPSPPAATEWSLLIDVICSERVTVHFQWGGNLSLVTLTFDLDIQTRPSEGPSTSSL